MSRSVRYLLLAVCVVGLVAGGCDDGGDDDNDNRSNGDRTTSTSAGTGGTRPEEQGPIDSSGDPGGGALEEYPTVDENVPTTEISGRLGSTTAPSDDPSSLATCEWVETDDGRVGLVASLQGASAPFLFLISDEGFSITDQAGDTVVSEGERVRVTGPAATHPLVPAGLTTGECGDNAIFVEQVSAG
jgi:hypothetical protein